MKTRLLKKKLSTKQNPGVPNEPDICIAKITFTFEISGIDRTDISQDYQIEAAHLLDEIGWTKSGRVND